MDITYYGHSSFGVSIGGKNILFDPFITPNPLASDIQVESIPVDYLLVTHAHQDHVADVEQIGKRSGALLVSTYEIATHFESLGLQAHPMNIGGSKQLYEGLRVKMVNAVHTSTFADGKAGGSPSGFVVQSAETTFYYAGDTALTYDMKLIAEEFSVDCAFLPIGDNFTMGIEDAVKAADFVGTDTIIGMHYDTFPYIAIDVEKAQQYAADHGKKLIILAIGQTQTL